MKTISFKVTDDEDRLIRALARRHATTLSGYLRQQAVAPSPPQAKPALVKCPHTGALIFDPLHGTPPLTSEAVREMLTDFP